MRVLSVVLLVVALSCISFAADPTVADLTLAMKAKAKQLEPSTGMRQAYKSILIANRLNTTDLNYSDFVIARVLFEASR